AAHYNAYFRYSWFCCHLCAYTYNHVVLCTSPTTHHWSRNHADSLLHRSRRFNGLFPVLMNDAYMTHLPERLGEFFAVEMQVYAIESKGFLDAFITCQSFMAGFTQQIDHNGIGPRSGIARMQVEDRTEVLRKLGSEIAFNALVATVVRAWRQFVNQQLTIF